MKLTVVIPTRERANTLQHSLATVVAQDYADLTILVSDNASTDNTRAVIESFKDSRIRYINPGKRLSMSHHWEFALTHVQDGYVMVIGDDDGVVPGGILRIASLLAQYDSPDAMICSKCLFFWENASAHFKHHEIPSRSLRFKLSDQVEWLDSQTMLHRLSAQKTGYQSLPSIYRGVVKTTVITRAMRSGVFFRSINPDIYSAVAVAAVTKRYLLVEQPFAIEGVSENSTGLSALNARPASTQATVTPAAEFLGEENIPWHPKLPKLLLLAFCNAEAIMQARDAGLLPDDFPVDIPALMFASLKEVEGKSDGGGRPLQEQLRTAAAVHGIALQFGSTSANSHKLSDFAPVKNHWRTGNISGRCPPNVATVADAAVFLNRFLRWRKLLLGVTGLWTAGSMLKRCLLRKKSPTISC